MSSTLTTLYEEVAEAVASEQPRKLDGSPDAYKNGAGPVTRLAKKLAAVFEAVDPDGFDPVQFLADAGVIQ